MGKPIPLEDIQELKDNLNLVESMFEEGSFTPELAFGGNSVGIVYARQRGKYTKIGKRIWFDINVVVTNKGSSTGDVSIKNLPYTSSTEPPFFVAVVYTNAFTLPAGAKHITPFVNWDSTEILIRAVGDASIIFIKDSDYTNTSSSTIAVSGSYLID